MSRPALAALLWAGLTFAAPAGAARILLICDSITAWVMHNVVGTFPGVAGGPTLVFSAHYDTATHFGDHFTWA